MSPAQCTSAMAVTGSARRIALCRASKTSAANRTHARYLEEMDSGPAQQIFLVRHGETEWSRTGRHTGWTDVPLTAEGRRQAQAIADALAERALHVRSSPLIRALETCRLAGLAGSAEIDDDLREWDYGIYEGRTTLEIRKETPGWSVWLSPIVNGESLEIVAERARRVIDRAAAAAPSDVALFAH